MSQTSPGKCSSLLSKQQNILKSLKRLYDSEPFLVKLNSLLPKGDIIDIKSFLSMQTQLLEKKLSTQESLPPNKKKIYNTKLNLFNKNFLNTQLFKTLALDLTLKERVLSPFWNKSSMEKSKKLLLPTMTDLLELDLNSFCSSVQNSTQNLPFSQIKMINNQKMNSQMNSSQLLPITQQNSMECENTSYTRKIRFYPNQSQKKEFEKFFGASRFLYNKTISLFREKKPDEKISLSLSSVRSLVMRNNKDIEDTDDDAWLKDIPYDTRQLAIKNALSSLKSAFALLKNKQIKHFHHKFKSKKDNSQTFFVDHRGLKNLHLFPSLLKQNSELKVNKKYEKYKNYVPTSDCVIMKNGKQYFILFSKEKEKNEKPEQKNHIISLDPGIRTFQSFYTPDGYVGSLGDKNLKIKILKKEKKIDKLKSLMSLSKKKNSRLRNKCFKLKTKVKNIISDFHWKISSFLTKNYKVVLLPVFKTQDLKENLNSYNNRILDVYSHYQFQQKMIYQGKKYGCQVEIVEEHYTTKTCGNCGHMNHFVGSSHVFWCPNCKIELDRDYQAARNILIKNTQDLINPLRES